VAELVLQALQEKCESTRFCMVRFGNVLESSGSVVPLFREQIRQGGPVTVTHRDIVRYFMTIQEAAELVIQAGSMAEGGDVFVLDMGDPVEIFELAKRMILLTGMTLRDEENPDGDIEIVFTGLRPGEKLYEELLVGADVSGTEHPRIMRAVETFIRYPKFKDIFAHLTDALRTRDSMQTRNLLLELVDNYKPSGGIDDLVWKARNPDLKQVHAKNVTEISARLGQK
jgi:FlaA1/EpsC-like NDP-sugar epimerase